MRGDFEVEGVSEQLCERFSKRHTQIDEALAKLLAEKPELAGANFQALRAQLATAERSRKQKDLRRAELLTLWEAQLSEAERASLRQLSKLPGNALNEKNRITVSEAVHWAEEHLFDRNSVVLECQVWQEALGRARGEGFSVSQLKEFTQQRGYIRDARGFRSWTSFATNRNDNAKTRTVIARHIATQPTESHHGRPKGIIKIQLE